VEDLVKTCSMMEDVLHKVKNIETAQTDCVLKEDVGGGPKVQRRGEDRAAARL